MPTCATYPGFAQFAESLVAAALLLVMCAPAQAAGVAVQVPPDCGSEAAFARRLVELTGPERAEKAAAVVQITQLDAERFGLRVAFAEDAREVIDRECSALFEAAVVMVALRVDPTLGRTAPDAPSAPLPVEPSPQLPASASHSPPPSDPAPALKARNDPPAREPYEPAGKVGLSGSLDGGVSHGLLPRPGAALGLGAAAAYGVVGARAALHYLPPRDGTGTPSASVQGAGATLLLTWLPVGWLTVGAGLESHLLWGRGQGVRAPSRERIATSAAKLELSFTVARFAHSQLALAVGGGIAFLRPHFVVRNHGSVHRPALSTAALAVRWTLDFL